MVVDDNSPDNTGGIVENLKRKYPNLLLLKRTFKNGLGRAYVDGFKKALENPEFKTITMMDADLSHDPKYLPEMLGLAGNFDPVRDSPPHRPFGRASAGAVSNGVDLVIGSRYVPKGGVTKKWEIWRRILSAGGNLYLRLIFWRFPIHDWTTGYNVIKTDELRKINFELLNPKGYAFISSLKYYLAKAGAKIKESPIFFEERNGGESKMSPSIIIEGILVPWKILTREIFKKLLP